MYFEIIVYDEDVLQQLAQRCPEAQYLDFPTWFRQNYTPLIKLNATQRLIRDYRHFERFYIASHPEDQDLLSPVRRELEERGIWDIPAAPPDPARFRDFSPYVRQGKLLAR